MDVTCYVLEDESVADPAEVSEVDGRLVHSSGVAVAMAPHGPRTRSVTHQALAAASKKRADAARPKGKAAKSPASRDMKPEAGQAGYKTK